MNRNWRLYVLAFAGILIVTPAYSFSADPEIDLMSGKEWNQLTWPEALSYVIGLKDGARMARLVPDFMNPPKAGSLTVVEAAAYLLSFYATPANAPIGIPIALYIIDLDLSGADDSEREFVLEMMRTQSHFRTLAILRAAANMAKPAESTASTPETADSLNEKEIRQ